MQSAHGCGTESLQTDLTNFVSLKDHRSCICELALERSAAGCRSCRVRPGGHRPAAPGSGSRSPATTRAGTRRSHTRGRGIGDCGFEIRRRDSSRFGLAIRQDSSRFGRCICSTLHLHSQVAPRAPALSSSHTGSWAEERRGVLPGAASSRPAARSPDREGGRDDAVVGREAERWEDHIRNVAALT
jgi:hypothetical protein